MPPDAQARGVQKRLIVSRGGTLARPPSGGPIGEVFVPQKHIWLLSGSAIYHSAHTKRKCGASAVRSKPQTAVTGACRGMAGARRGRLPLVGPEGPTRRYGNDGVPACGGMWRVDSLDGERRVWHHRGTTERTHDDQGRQAERKGAVKSVTTNLRRPFRQAHDGYEPRRTFTFRPKITTTRPRFRGGRRRHMRPKR